MKKNKKVVNKALNHILVAIASFQENNGDAAVKSLANAVKSDDLQEAVEIIEESQDIEVDIDDADLDAALEDAKEEVASFSNVKRRRLVRKAVALSSLTQEEANEIDIENADDLVDALVEACDSEEALRTLAELELIENADDYVVIEEEEDDDDLDSTEEEAKVAIARVLGRSNTSRRSSRRR